MSGGRPTKYDPAYCQSVVAFGAEGKTLAEMADGLNVDRATIKNWCDEYPEFFGAVKAGLDKAQAWWENQGRIATFGGCEGFNATSYIFQMKNRFKDDWREKQDHEHSGPNGGAIPHAVAVTFRKPADADG